MAAPGEQSTRWLVVQATHQQWVSAHTFLRQDRPEVDHAVSLATRAVQTLTGEVYSARCVGYLTRLVGDFAPYRRRPAVRQFTEQATGLLTPVAS